MKVKGKNTEDPRSKPWTTLSMVNNTFFMFGGFGYTKDTGFIHNFQYFLKVMNKFFSPTRPHHI
jgi:hypothetical protein